MAQRPVEQEAPESLHEVWTTNLWVLYTKHSNKIGALLIIASLSLLGYTYYQGRIQQIREDSWGRMATATSPVSFRNIAQDYEGKPVAHLASLSAADLLLSEAVTVRSNETEDVNVEENLAEAETLYRSALNGSDQGLIRINALFGLASIAECRQAWDQAQEYYTSAQNLADADYPYLAAIARNRAAELPSLEEEVVIAESSILDDLNLSEDAAGDVSSDITLDPPDVPEPGMEALPDGLTPAE